MGWEKDADGVKYFSRASRCFEGAAWQRVWMTRGISATETMAQIREKIMKEIGFGGEGGEWG